MSLSVLLAAMATGQSKWRSCLPKFSYKYQRSNCRYGDNKDQAVKEAEAACYGFLRYMGGVYARVLKATEDGAKSARF